MNAKTNIVIFKRESPQKDLHIFHCKILTKSFRYTYEERCGSKLDEKLFLVTKNIIKKYLDSKLLLQMHRATQFVDSERISLPTLVILVNNIVAK